MARVFEFVSEGTVYAFVIDEISNTSENAEEFAIELKNGRWMSLKDAVKVQELKGILGLTLEAPPRNPSGLRRVSAGQLV
jgi:hypothetical protein